MTIYARVYRHEPRKGGRQLGDIAVGEVGGKAAEKFLRSFVAVGVSVECEEAGVKWRWVCKVDKVNLTL